MKHIDIIRFLSQPGVDIAPVRSDARPKHRPGSKEADNIKMRTVGRSPLQVELEVVGEITEADLERLFAPRPEGVPTVQKLRDSHHNLARLLASGVRIGQASVLAGYSQSRASILMADPAFQELIAQYRKEFTGAATDAYQEFMADAQAVLRMSARQIRDRLEDADEKPLPLSELRSNVVEFGDRLGFAKQTINHNINTNLADRLAAARQRVFGAGQREGLPAPTPPVGEPLSSPSIAAESPIPSASTKAGSTASPGGDGPCPLGVSSLELEAKE